MKPLGSSLCGGSTGRGAALTPGKALGFPLALPSVPPCRDSIIGTSTWEFHCLFWLLLSQLMA